MSRGGAHVLASWGLLLALVSSSPLGAQPGPEAADVYALIIGWNGGAEGLPTLHYADDDAIRMARLLGNLAQGRPEAVQLLTEVDEETRQRLVGSAPLSPRPLRPTRHAVLAAVARLRKQLSATRDKRPRQVFVHYAGHGLSDRVLLAPERELPATLSGRELWLALLELAEAAEDVRVFLTVDACRAQSLFNLRGGAPLPSGPDFSEEIRAMESRARRRSIGLLTASSAGNPAAELRGIESGLFSHVLLSGLSGAADASGDDVVSFGELAAFVALYTQRVTGQTPWFEPPEGRLSSPLVSLRARMPRLSVDAAVAGRVDVRAEGPIGLTVQTHKQPNQRLSLTLPPGRYRIVNRAPDGQVRDALVELAPEQNATVGATDWTHGMKTRGTEGDAGLADFATAFTPEVVATLNVGYESGRATSKASPQRARNEVVVAVGAARAAFELPGIEARLGMRYRRAFGPWFLGAAVSAARSSQQPGQMRYDLDRYMALLDFGFTTTPIPSLSASAFGEVGNTWLIRRADAVSGDAWVPTVGVGGRISWRWNSGFMAEASAGYLHAWADVDDRARGTGTVYGEGGVGYAF